MSDMLTPDQREHWRGGEHRPGPGSPPSAQRRYVGVRRAPSEHRVLSVLGPLAALAVTAASATLFLTGATRAPSSNRIVQLPGICSNCGPGPAGTLAPAAAGQRTRARASHSGTTEPPRTPTAAQPLSRGQTPPAASTPSSSDSPLVVEVPPLPPVPTLTESCPIPTKHGKGRPSKAPDVDN